LTTKTERNVKGIRLSFSPTTPPPLPSPAGSELDRFSVVTGISGERIFQQPARTTPPLPPSHGIRLDHQPATTEHSSRSSSNSVVEGHGTPQINAEAIAGPRPLVPQPYQQADVHPRHSELSDSSQASSGQAPTRVNRASSQFVVRHSRPGTDPPIGLLAKKPQPPTGAFEAAH
jgi:hypothetical protein